MILLALVIVLSWLYLRPLPRPLFVVYQQRGIWFWPKAALMFLIITRRRKNNTAGNGNSGAGYGAKSKTDIRQLEVAQPLADHPLAVDAVLFSGGNKNGTYIVISCARRKLGVANMIVMIVIPGIGLLKLPKHPDTMVFQDGPGWVGEGLELVPVEPMRKWSVKYNGELVAENGAKHLVSLHAEYISNLPYFDFDSDMDPWTVSRAMAVEAWSKDYFGRLREAHQNHYEQFGEVKGEVEVDDQKRHINVDVMRDHTHGSVRDWRLMHRYCLHNFTTSSGLRGFVGVVSQPVTFSLLELGYIYTPAGTAIPVEEVDLPMWALGEGGADPSDYGFRFRAGGEWYEVAVLVQGRAQVMFGWEWEARVIERFCRYSINGEEGWGVSEWEYRHMGGRPDKYSQTDPQHLKDVPKF